MPRGFRPAGRAGHAGACSPRSAAVARETFLSMSGSCVAETPNLRYPLALPELTRLALGAQSSRHKGLHQDVLFPGSV